MKTVSSRVEKIVFLYSRSWLERKEGNRYVERILSLLGAANDWKEVERRRRAWKILLHGMNRWQVLKWNYIVVGRVCARETDLERNERGYRVYTTGTGQPASNIFSSGCYEWLAIIDAVVELPTQHRPENRQIRGETYVRTYGKRELAIVHIRASIPATTIHYRSRATVTRSAILDRRCVNVT